MRIAVFLLLVTGAMAAFPVTTVKFTQAQLDTMLSNATKPDAKDALATSNVLPYLRAVFGPTSTALQVTPDDVSIDGPIPDATIDDSCSHKVTSHGGTAGGAILDTSYLRFGVKNISWTGVSVFAEAELDAQLTLKTDVTVKVGAKVFKHCDKIAQKTVGIDVLSKGQNGVGITFTAYNASVVPIKGGFELVFNFHASVVGLIIDWDIDHIDVSHCTIEILGIKILSYCGVLEKLIKTGVNNLLGKTEAVVAPRLQHKLESAINTAIGSIVRIPITI